MVLGLGRHTPFLVGKDGSRQDSECELVLLEQAPHFPLEKAPPGVVKTYLIGLGILPDEKLPAIIMGNAVIIRDELVGLLQRPMIEGVHVRQGFGEFRFDIQQPGGF